MYTLPTRVVRCPRVYDDPTFSHDLNNIATIAHNELAATIIIKTYLQESTLFRRNVKYHLPS